MDLLIGDVFRKAARAVPDRVAVVLGDTSLTFARLDARANQVARALAAHGIRPLDRVAAWSATDLDLVTLFAGTAKLGAVFAPISGLLTADEAAPVLRAADAAVVVADRGHVALAASLGREVLDLHGLGAREPTDDVDAPSIGEHDPHVVFFTSGSTGRPKGAVISHRASWLRTTPGLLPEPRGAMVCPYPLFHMAAWTIGLQQWQARDRVVFLESADAASICAAVSTHGAARLNCVPAVWRRILEHAAALEHAVDLSSLRFADTGTSATPVELLEAIASAAPRAQVRVFYGSTEAGSVTCLEHADLRRKPGSCGVPGPSVEVRVDEAGVLWCRGPATFDGYQADAGATAEALVDGWCRTGDVAELDDEGYVTIVGRAGDVIRTGGESVAPVEVEALLGSHPAVGDVAVVGLPDAQWGEVVCAVVVPRAGAEPPSVGALRQHCEGRLAGFKHPRRVVVVEAIPRTASTGQVQRRLLLEQVAPG